MFSGVRVVSLSGPAVSLLATLPRLPGNPWVLPGRKPGTNLRPYALARAFTTCAYTTCAIRSPLALGERLSMIGKLLGHARMETTSRYAHLARDSVRESAEWLAASIAEDIL